MIGTGLDLRAWSPRWKSVPGLHKISCFSFKRKSLKTDGYIVLQGFRILLAVGSSQSGKPREVQNTSSKRGQFLMVFFLKRVNVAVKELNTSIYQNWEPLNWSRSCRNVAMKWEWSGKEDRPGH